VTSNEAARLQPDEGDHEDEPEYHHDPLKRELARLKDANDPIRRGRDFEQLVASIFRRRHFRVVLNPGTARPRQTDLLATRGNDAYLVETKWQAAKADIDDVDTLFTRLDAVHSGVVGLMISFTGFSATAIERTEQQSDRPVLLMTGAELEQVIHWDEDIAHLLARKKAYLLTHRRALLATARRRGDSPTTDGLVAAPAEFVFPDASRARWIAGKGDFGEFTFVQELPDIDWNWPDGRGVTLDMPVPVYDQGGILDLLHHLSNMGWASDDARWSIQQSSTNWHGLGARDFAEALKDWKGRYKGIRTHHSEEFCYFDKCEDGFYCLTSNLAAHKVRAASYTMLSFQLAGVPLDAAAYRELSRTFDVGYQCYFRPMKRRSVKRRWHLTDPYRLMLEPVALIVERDEVFNYKREWVRGLAAKNPFFKPGSTLAEREPGWMPSHVFDSELLICALRSWHPLDDHPHRYQLCGCESARTADAVIVRPIADWLDDDDEPRGEVPPRP
jgi:Restriction endonuclease